MEGRKLDSDIVHRVFINGNILTMDDKDSVAEAVSVKDGKIEAVGSSDEIKNLIGNRSDVTDLEGKTLIPGFIETHGHFPGSGIDSIGANLASPPIGTVETIPQALDLLKTRAATLEKGKWLVAIGYDDTLVKENRHLTRDDLDQVSTEHPICATHVSGHVSYANSRALEAIGFTDKTPDPEGGVICREKATGRLIGILEEEAAFVLTEQAFQFSPEEQMEIVNSSVKDYASKGVTSAQLGHASEAMLSGVSMASKFGLIPLRVMAWPDVALAEKILEGKYDIAVHASEIFHIGATKIIGDGSIQAYTAYLTQPYHMPFKGDKSHRGYPVVDRVRMVELVGKFHRAGMQIAVHGNGDATIDDIIHAIDEARKKHPREDHRHIIIHCQTVREDQLREMKRLGITPSFFPAHQYYWGDRHMSIFLGPQRALRQNPCRSARDLGIRFTIHLDTPVVPMNMLLLMWSAVNRISTGGNIIGEEERISAIDALRAVTIDGAWQIFQEDNRGSIETGKYADLVVLSDDPLKDPAGIKDMEVLETIVGGKTVYRK